MKTILVVEDDNLTRRVYRTAMEKAGHSVVEATTANAAVDTFQKTRPDGILLDIFLEGSNGLDALKTIRSLPNGHAVPVVVVVTNALVPALREEAQKLGALYIFSKSEVSLSQLPKFFVRETDPVGSDPVITKSFEPLVK